MAILTISSDPSISNYHALEAVGKWMLENYHQRKYLDLRVITVDSGKKITVEQVEHEDKESICSGSFIVTKGD